MWQIWIFDAKNGYLRVWEKNDKCDKTLLTTQMIVLAALVAVAVAGKIPPPPTVTIVKESPLEITSKGSSFSYELSDGQARSEVNNLKTIEVVGPKGEKELVAVNVVKGSYVTIDPVTGQKLTIEFIADENGYRPVGAHLPVAPVA